MLHLHEQLPNKAIYRPAPVQLRTSKAHGTGMYMQSVKEEVSEEPGEKAGEENGGNTAEKKGEDSRDLPRLGSNSFRPMYLTGPDHY